MLPATFENYSFRLIAVLLGAEFVLGRYPALAQIADDNTTKTQIYIDGNFTSITGGIEAGSNLFHSFEAFSVSEGQAANFEHSSEIINIFSRVTGGQISEIEGLIETQGDASLFLLNPAGIIFGENAQLDVGGSVVFSTGERLVFADGTEFAAVTPKPESLLTISLPVGIQYGSGTGTIEVLPNNNLSASNFDLSVYPGNTLAFLGGDIFFSGNSLAVTSSKIEVASIKSGTVNLQPEELGWQFDYDASSTFGQIQLSDHANIHIDGGGRVNFQAESIAFSTASGVLDFNQFSELKTQVKLAATKAIEIDGGLIVTQVGTRSGATADVITDAGGDIVMEAPKISLSNGAIISAATLSDGNGGNIKIRARDVRLFSEDNHNPAIITTSTGGMGQGGLIKINTDRLHVENGSQIQALTTGLGSGGTISVNAESEIQLTGTGKLRSQDTDGNLSITELASGFSASSGDENISVADPAEFAGAGGSLVIQTPKLTIDDSAQISVGSYSSANAGDIQIHTSHLKLDRAGQIVANTASNAGGSINIESMRSLILDRKGAISTTAANAGNGGNISLVTENLALLDNNHISADASQGRGGNIYIDTQGLFIDPSSNITASSQVEQNNGTVTISTIDFNSRLATNYIEPASLAGEDEITSGCGVGISLYSDQIRNLGRGGIPHNPLLEPVNLEAWGDIENKLEPTKTFDLAAIDWHNTNHIFQPIVEVERWVVNSQGKVELIANTAKSMAMFNCSL